MGDDAPDSANTRVPRFGRSWGLARSGNRRSLENTCRGPGSPGPRTDVSTAGQSPGNGSPTSRRYPATRAETA